MWGYSEMKAFAEYVKPYLQISAKARVVRNSQGEKVPIPMAEKRVNMRQLVQGFEEQQTSKLRQQGKLVSFAKRRRFHKGEMRPSGPKLPMIKKTIKRKRLYNFVKLTCPTSLKCLKAVDSMSWRDGCVNFDNLEKSVEIMKLMLGTDAVFEVQKKKLIDLIKFCQFFAKDRDVGLWSRKHRDGHRDGTCACHCAFYMFNEKDPNITPNDYPSEYPCGHNHNDENGNRLTCTECEKAHSLKETFEEVYTYFKQSLNLPEKHDNVSIKSTIYV